MLRLLWILGLVGCLTGCPKSKPVEPVAKSPPAESERPPLRILVMGDAAWSEAISRKWLSISEQPLDVQSITLEAILESNSIQADVLILESQWLPTAAERGWISPLPKSVLGSSLDTLSGVTSENLRQIAWPVVWRQSASYGQRLWGIPLGVPMMAIVNQSEKRLPALGTWRERMRYSPLERDEELVPSSKEDRVLSDSYLIDRFLVLAANWNPQPDDVGFLFNINTGLARLDEPWLLEVVTLWGKQFSNQVEFLSMPPEKTWESVAANKSTWGWAWPPLGGESSVDVQTPERWVDTGRGLVATVSSKNRQSGPANRFLLWLDEDKQRQDFAALSRAIQPTPERWSVSTERADMNRYRELMKQAFDDRFVVRELRFANSQPYRQRLTEALLAIIQDPASAETALQRCAADWNQITAKLGRDLHKKRLARSFELEPYRN